MLSGILCCSALRGVILFRRCLSLRGLPDDVHPCPRTGELGSDADGHLDQPLVGAQLLGQAAAGHRCRQHRALLQGDRGPTPHRLPRGGQRGLGERAGRERARRDVLLGEDRSGADRVRGDENLLSPFRTGAQHAERHQDRGSQAEGHHQVAMSPQQ